MIFGRGRSGSTLLSSLLNQSDEIQCAPEILFHYTKFPLLKIHYHETICPNKIFGFKLLTYQLADVHKARNNFQDFLDPILVDKNYKLIYLYRENILHQAISNYVAFKRGKFHQSKGENKHSEQFEVDVDEIFMWLNKLKDRIEVENQILPNYEHLKINYEEDLLNPACHQKTINRIVSFIGAKDYQVRLPGLEKIVSKKPLSDILINYNDLKNKLTNTDFETYLYQ